MGHMINSFLQSQPVLSLFLVLGVGVCVGKIKIGGTEFGSVTGVLFVGLIAGHTGVPIHTASVSMGFIRVGVQPSPRFWGSFKQDGGRYLVLVLVTAGAAVFLKLTLSHTFGFLQGYAPGILAGALTSAPTLVAAQDALSQGIKMAEGLSRQDIVANLSTAYAITTFSVSPD